MSQLELRSEPEAELLQHQRRLTDDNEDSFGEVVADDSVGEVGRKYFEELVNLGKIIGWCLLVLVAVTIVLSIFYRPFYITRIEEKAADQRLGDDIRETVPPLTNLASCSLASENVSSIKFLSHQSENLWSHQYPEVGNNLFAPQDKAMSARLRANDVFVRLTKVDNNPVFNYASPVITPFVRRRTGTLHAPTGGTIYTFKDRDEKKELKYDFEYDSKRFAGPSCQYELGNS